MFRTIGKTVDAKNRVRMMDGKGPKNKKTMEKNPREEKILLGRRVGFVCSNYEDVRVAVLS